MVYVIPPSHLNFYQAAMKVNLSDEMVIPPTNSYSKQQVAFDSNLSNIINITGSYFLKQTNKHLHVTPLHCGKDGWQTVFTCE